MKLIFATNNHHKADEIRSVLNRGPETNYVEGSRN